MANFKTVPLVQRSAPVAAAAVIKSGDLIQLNAAGYAIPVPTSGWAATSSRVLGYAVDGVDNSLGANGDSQVTIRACEGFQVTLTGAAITDVGEKVYANGPASVTKTLAANEPDCGEVWQYSGTDKVFVIFRKVGL